MNELALFAGAGGGILGGHLLGWRTVCAVEFAAYPRSVLLARQRDGMLPKFPIWDDVRTFDGKPWRGKVDVVSGGFPCTDISAAGKGAGIEGEHSGLWSEMARIIGEVLPHLVFVENSPLLVGRGAAMVIGDLAAMGYDAEWCCVSASECGAPHQRDRFWLVAYAERAASNERPEFMLRRRRQGETEQTWMGCGEHTEMADTNSQRSHGTRSCCTGRPEFEDGGFRSDVANSNSNSVQGLESEPQQGGHGRPARLFSGARELRPWPDDPADAPKSDVGRVADGVAARVDRLKAIGNGQVPRVAATAWRILTHNVELRGRAL